MNDLMFRVYAVKTKLKKVIMKQRIISMLVGLTLMTGASAQGTELIERGAVLYLTDSLKLDSMYNYWNGFVVQHPKDDVAWRNLFEICYNQEFRLRVKNWEAGVGYYRENMVPLLERIKKAIPTIANMKGCLLPRPTGENSQLTQPSSCCQRMLLLATTSCGCSTSFRSATL